MLVEFYSLREEEWEEGFKLPQKKKGPHLSSQQYLQTRSQMLKWRLALRPKLMGFLRLDMERHSVTVKSTSGRQEITKKAIAEHSSFDQKFDGSISYGLPFPDFSDVNDEYSSEVFSRAWVWMSVREK